MTKLVDIEFSDIYLTPEGRAFISDGKTALGLQILKDAEDLKRFYKEVEVGWNGGRPSYSLAYDGAVFRVERVHTSTGIAFCARRMPKVTPDITRLGFPEPILQHLISLNRRSGLILWGGATGSGKTTAISCLLKKYLEREGGFAYTIEDPPELPLDGVYASKRGGLGLCKQTEPPSEDWGYALKSALRSRPYYIMVGEIRTPDTASQVLRAATSGHLVLSTIHANSVEDAISSTIKYAAAGDMSEELAYSLFSRGILAVFNQKLVGEPRPRPELGFVFANPDSYKGDQVRAVIKSGSLNLATVMEAQAIKLFKGDAIFDNGNS